VNGIERMAAMYTAHSVPPDQDVPRPPFRLPEEFLASRRGVQVGNVLETLGGAAAADDERRTAR
jgi:hypothetical protein